MPAPLRIPPSFNAADGLLDPTVVVTLEEAAALCGVSMYRVRYRLRAGMLPGAHRLPGDGSGRWALPLGDLVACGLLAQARVSRGTAAQSETARLAAEVEGLRRELQAREQEVLFLRSLLNPGAGQGSAA